MDDEKKAIALGLGAGLGGFAGILIFGCICWNICCGTWCDKKTVKPTVLPVRNQRPITTTSKVSNNLSVNIPIRNPNMCSDFVSTTSNDLASKIQSSHR